MNKTERDSICHDRQVGREEGGWGREEGEKGRSGTHLAANRQTARLCFFDQPLIHFRYTSRQVSGEPAQYSKSGLPYIRMIPVNSAAVSVSPLPPSPPPLPTLSCPLD